ncbi:carboxypeptidase regulatory-like domain-containing protein [Legionella rowbothamii]|uniref:carboxypeptidase regulatory-like domain-containing protein n=1 Tax=Legionella rowbothamii TaxID=96229 RepID=UPI001056BC74|nr:carboxypeptidase regulatory-like domain-containing protein [Legionella rowbothamii]
MNQKTALVSGFARSFISGNAIAGGFVWPLGAKEKGVYTDSEGKFSIEWPVGQPITLVFEKPGSYWSGYKTTQSATLIVPPEGINDKNYLKNVSFQVPSEMAYSFIQWAAGFTPSPDKGQIAATITPPNMTLDDIPQGIEGVKVRLSPEVETAPFYFGIFPITHKTNPFDKSLTSTSLDGGILFSNVPPGEYDLYAEKEGYVFSKVHVTARAGVLVNASPPNGPTQQVSQTAENALIKESARVKTNVSTNSNSFFKPAAVIGLAVAATACVATAVISSM